MTGEGRAKALEGLGWSAEREGEWEALGLPACEPARVVEKHLRAYTLGTVQGARQGFCRQEFVQRGGGWPALGDWVAVEALPGEDKLLIRAILPRRGSFTRSRAGDTLAEQVVAANVDVVFLVCALGEDFSPRRIERYLAAAYSFGARPVIVINKADLRPEASSELAQARALSAETPVHLVSAETSAGLEELRRYLAPGVTAAFVGSSGVGKSSLINRLVGAQVLKVAAVRASDEEGRHTTTSGRLVPLPGGGLLVDTAGMREVQLWESAEGVERVFAEIEAAAAACKFGDCSHAAEPGCRVREALEGGQITAERLASWRKLKRELHHQLVKDDQIAEAKEKRRWKQQSRARRRRDEDKKR